MSDLEKEILRILDDPNTERNDYSLKNILLSSEEMNTVNLISRNEREEQIETVSRSSSKNSIFEAEAMNIVNLISKTEIEKEENNNKGK